MGEPTRLGPEGESKPRVHLCSWATSKTATCEAPARAVKRDGRTYHEGLCPYHGDIEFSARWQARWKSAASDFERAALRRECDAWLAKGRQFYGPTPDRQYIDRRAGE